MDLKTLSLLVGILFSVSVYAEFPEDCIPPNEISAEERELGRRFVDNILEFELDFGGRKFILTRNGALSEKGKPSKQSDSLKKVASSSQHYSSYSHNGITLLESGSDTLEGHLSQVHIIDTEKGEVVSTLQKCSSQNDHYFTHMGKLNYFCEHHCEHDLIYQLNKKNQKFEKIVNKKFCSVAKNSRKLEFKSAKIKRTKNPNGKEYSTSFFPLKICKDNF